MLLFIIVYILVDYSQYDYLCNSLVCQKIVFAIQNIFTCRSDYSINIVNIRYIYNALLVEIKTIFVLYWELLPHL